MIKWLDHISTTCLKRNTEAPTRLFTSGLYAFLIIKIIVLIPIANDITTYYRYHSTSFIKRLIVGPGILATQFPTPFLIGSLAISIGLLLVKRNYYLNFLGFWLSLNVSQFTEPVTNGSDYVLNLMLLLSIPLSGEPPLSKLKYLQPIFYSASVVLIQAHIALIYFLSGFDKLMTKGWRSGEAISYITSLDYYANPVAASIISPHLNSTIAWIVIGFELLFPFLIWFKFFRVPILIAGVLFHLGIIYFLNLPDFGLLMIICYAIFLKK